MGYRDFEIETLPRGTTFRNGRRTKIFIELEGNLVTYVRKAHYSPQQETIESFEEKMRYDCQFESMPMECTQCNKSYDSQETK